VRIDPTTDKVSGYAITGPVVDMTAAQGALWVLARGKLETPLLRVDPQTLKSETVRLTGTPDELLADSLAITSDSLWLFSQAYGKIYRASLTGRLYAEIPLGQHKIIGPADLLAAGGALWLAAPWGSLVRVDMFTTTLVGEMPIGAPLGELAEVGGWLWAPSPLEGLVYRVDSSGAATARVEVGEKLKATPIVTPTPIQRASRPCDTGPYSRLLVGGQAHTLNAEDSAAPAQGGR
jgi:hypothetical protein